MISTITSLKKRWLAPDLISRKALFLLGVGLCAYHAAFSQTARTCFSYSLKTHTVGTHPIAMLNGKFKSSYSLDFVVVNQSSDNVSVLLRSNATGTLGAAVHYSVQNMPVAIAANDVDNDGLNDIVVANEGSNTVSVLTNTNGIFSTYASYPTGLQPKAIALQDLNGDYFPEMVVANSGSGNITVLFGSLSGSFSGAVNYGTGINPVAIHSNDFNGDGFPDLAVANRGSNSVSVLLGSASGTFAASVNYSVGMNPEALSSSDFNADGYVDLATANAGSDNVSILFGSATGTFTNGGSYAVGDAPNSIAVADFDLDGYQDLVTANGGSNDATILFGSTTGIFSSATNYTMGNSPHAIIASDIDKNGSPDLIVTNYSSNTISILYNGTLKLGFYFVSPGGGLANPTCPGAGGLTIWLTNPYTPANTYIWSTFATGPYLVVNPYVTTTYSVTGMSVPGCSYTAATTVTVWPSPNISLTAGDSSICRGESVTLKAYGGVNYAWFLPGSIYNSRIVTPTVTTQYVIVGIDARGCEKIAALTVTVSLCTGLEDFESTDHSVSVYPNPSTDLLNLSFSQDLSFADVSMSDLQGRQVYAHSFKQITKDEIKTIHVKDLAPGLYLLNLNTDHYSGTHKIMVQH